MYTNVCLVKVEQECRAGERERCWKALEEECETRHRAEHRFYSLLLIYQTISFCTAARDRHHLSGCIVYCVLCIDQHHLTPRLQRGGRLPGPHALHRGAGALPALPPGHQAEVPRGAGAGVQASPGHGVHAETEGGLPGTQCPLSVALHCTELLV